MIKQIKGIFLVETTPAVCVCGSELFELDVDESGTTAICRQCKRCYMSFEKMREANNV